MTNLILPLANSMQKVGVSTAYGDPVELGDTTLIPVALGGFGFGAGEGDGTQAENGEVSGAGGGGGSWSIPLGAYISDERGVRYDPNIVALAAVAIPLVCVAGRALSHIIRALKR
ncbi:MAG: spore germination protein GerW family protein [Mycetocola sp.]